MNDIFRQLGNLFAQSVPTALLILLLLVILDRIFFRPLAKVLRDREAASSGALERAKEHRKSVAAKAAEYEARFANPYVAAARGYVDEVILPSETRGRLASGLRVLEGKRQALPAKKHGNIPL